MRFISKAHDQLKHLPLDQLELTLAAWIKQACSSTTDLAGCNARVRLIPTNRLTEPPTNQLHGDEHYPIALQLCTHPIVSQHFTDSEGLLLHSQDQSSRHHCNLSLKDPS
jgi:hypothetical protein